MAKKRRRKKPRVCGDCHWYRTLVRHGKKRVSCKRVGVAEDEVPCERFAVTVPDKQEAEAMRIAVGTLTKPDHEQVFREILGERYVVERDLIKAFAEVNRLLEQQGPDHDESAFEQRRVSQEFLVNRVDLLMDFYALHRICLALGMGVYADDIVRAEIARRMVAQPPSGRKQR